jgi:hypothetical protein
MARSFAFALLILPLALSAADSVPLDPSAPPPPTAKPCLADQSDCSAQDPRPAKPCLAGDEKCDQSYQVKPAAPQNKGAPAARPGVPADGPRPASPPRR